MDNIYYTIAEQKMENLSYLLNEMPKRRFEKNNGKGNFKKLN